MKLLTETAEMSAAHAECSFESEDHLQDSIYHSLIEQPNIFASMTLVNEIDTLNNIQVVSNYTIGRVKSHYRQNEVRSHKAVLSPIKKNRENGSPKGKYLSINTNYIISCFDLMQSLCYNSIYHHVAIQGSHHTRRVLT